MGRAMFFEKPVGTAITASEIDEFARPIRKKEAKAVIPDVRFSASSVRTHARIVYVHSQDTRIIFPSILLFNGEFRWL